MLKRFNGLLFGLSLGVCGFFATNTQALTLNEPNYTITFSAGWQTTTYPSVLARYFSGWIAMVACVPGTATPNLDSLSKFYADSLGGHITRGKDSALTLGKYSVKWQEFSYDSLPKLSAMVSTLAPFPVSLQNGKFRVYYLVSDGLIFSITGLGLLPNGIPPDKDIETALKTLTLFAQAGIREIAGSWGGSEMWIHDGRLGGSWFTAHRPIGIDCFNLRGAWIGAAKPSGTNGIWTLPGVDQNAFLRIKLADGSRYHLPIRD